MRATTITHTTSEDTQLTLLADLTREQRTRGDRERQEAQGRASQNPEALERDTSKSEPQGRSIQGQNQRDRRQRAQPQSGAPVRGRHLWLVPEPRSPEEDEDPISGTAPARPVAASASSPGLGVSGASRPKEYETPSVQRVERQVGMGRGQAAEAEHLTTGGGRRRGAGGKVRRLGRRRIRLQRKLRRAANASRSTAGSPRRSVTPVPVGSRRRFLKPVRSSDELPQRPTNSARRTVNSPRGSAGSARRPMRITRRGRIVLLMLFVAVALGAFVLGTKAASWASAHKGGPVTGEVLSWVVVDGRATA